MEVCGARNIFLWCAAVDGSGGVDWRSGGVDDCVACGRRAEEMGLIRPWGCRASVPCRRAVSDIWRQVRCRTGGWFGQEQANVCHIRSDLS